jgi:hypothetical protein
MRLLLDEGVPVRVREQLPGHEVVTVRGLGWLGISNGSLLARAEAAGYDILVTGDRNMTYQQNLSGRRIAIVVLSTNHWASLQSNPELLPPAVVGVGQGGYVTVTYPRGPLRRRNRPSEPTTI